MDKALQTMISNMPEKTGKSLEQWKKVLAKQTYSKHSEAVKFLKTEHGVTHGFANTIVTLYNAKDTSEEDLITNQYNGKESLLSIYEKLIEHIHTLGSDVKIVPKKTSVSIIKKNQFLLIKPATKTRIDLGFKLKDKPTGSRLGDSGPFGTMCTHRVKLSSVDEIDAELIGWINEAYNR